MRSYSSLNKNIFSFGQYRIEPIRDIDKYSIMEMRNEQMYHLRQHSLLTEKDQESYFKNVVDTLFRQEKPQQLLFSYLKDDLLIGYGGLVHINYIDCHAEISFIMNSEKDRTEFGTHWANFLSMIEEVAFEELRLHKIFTYAFDLRPHLYIALEECGYIKEAVLPQHCRFEGRFIDVIIHSKIRNA